MSRSKAVLCGAVLLSACARADSSVAAADTSRAARIRDAAETVVLCQTRDSTLRRQLGVPSRTGRLHRERVLSWIVPNRPIDQYLAVLLDSTGTVVDIYWDVPTEAPWVPTNQCARR